VTRVSLADRQPQRIAVVAGLQNLPEQKVIKIGEFTIGLAHGHQVRWRCSACFEPAHAAVGCVLQIVPWGDPESLANLQRQMDVDILITGHTHKNEVPWLFMLVADAHRDDLFATAGL
jgi:predicted phosphodiesterase